MGRQQQTTIERLEVMREVSARRQLLTTTWLDPLPRRVTHLQEAVTRSLQGKETAEHGSISTLCGQDLGVQRAQTGRRCRS